MDDTVRMADEDEFPDEDAVEEAMFGESFLDSLEASDSDVEVVPPHQAATVIAETVGSDERATGPSPAPAEKARLHAGDDQGAGPGDPPPPAWRQTPLPDTLAAPRSRAARKQAIPPGPQGPDAPGRVAWMIIKRSLIIAGIGLGILVLLVLAGARVPSFIGDALAVNGWREVQPIGIGSPVLPDHPPGVEETTRLAVPEEQDPVGDPLGVETDPRDTWQVEFIPSSISSGMSSPMNATESERLQQTFADLMADETGTVATVGRVPGDEIPISSEPGPETETWAGDAARGAGVVAALAEAVHRLAQDIGRIRELLEVAMLPPAVIGDAVEAGSPDVPSPTTADMAAVGGPYDDTDESVAPVAATKQGAAVGDSPFVVESGTNPVLLTNGHAVIGVGDRVEGYGTVLEIHEAAAGRILVFE